MDDDTLTVGGDQGVYVAAANHLQAFDIGGAVAVSGGLSMAGGIDVGIVAGDTEALIGEDVSLAARGDVDVSAISLQDVTSWTGSAEGAAVGVEAAVSVWTLGTAVKLAYQTSEITGTALPESAFTSSVDRSANRTYTDSEGGQADGDYVQTLNSLNATDTQIGDDDRTDKGVPDGTVLVGKVAGLGAQHTAPDGSSRVADSFSAPNTGATRAFIASSPSAGDGNAIGITAGGDLNVTAYEQISLDQRTGAVLLDVAGIGASVAMATVHGEAEAGIEARVRVDGDVNVFADYEGDLVSDVIIGQAGASVEVAAGVGAISDDSTQRAYIAGGAEILSADQVEVRATRGYKRFEALSIEAEVGAVSLGASVAIADATGGTEAFISDAVLGDADVASATKVAAVNGVTIEAVSDVRPVARSYAVEGGLFFTAEGSYARATTTPDVRASLGTSSSVAAGDAAHLVGGDVSVVANSTAEPFAKGFGIAGAVGAAVGITYVEAVASPTVNAYVEDGTVLHANTLSGSSPRGRLQVLAIAADDPHADGLASGGGVILSGDGNWVTATLDSDVHAYIGSGAEIATQTDTRVEAEHEFVGYANAHGGSYGAIAVDENIANLDITPDVTAYIADDSSVVAGGDVIVEAESGSPGTLPDLTFDPATDVDYVNDIITFQRPHGLETGDVLVYRPGGSAAIGGLVEGKAYDVVRISSRQIRFGTFFRTGEVDERTSSLDFKAPHSFQSADLVPVDNSWQGSEAQPAEPVIYRAHGSEPLTGLYDGQVYYLNTSDPYNVKVAMTEDAGSDLETAVFDAASNVDYEQDEIQLPFALEQTGAYDTVASSIATGGLQGARSSSSSHFEVGDAVLFSTTYTWDGLEDRQVYYIAAMTGNPSLYHLAVSPEAAAVGSTINLSSAQNANKYGSLTGVDVSSWQVAAAGLNVVADEFNARNLISGTTLYLPATTSVKTGDTVIWRLSGPGNDSVPAKYRFGLDPGLIYYAKVSPATDPPSEAPADGVGVQFARTRAHLAAGTFVGLHQPSGNVTSMLSRAIPVSVGDAFTYRAPAAAKFEPTDVVQDSAMLGNLPNMILIQDSTRLPALGHDLFVAEEQGEGLIYELLSDYAGAEPIGGLSENASYNFTEHSDGGGRLELTLEDLTLTRPSDDFARHQLRLPGHDPIPGLNSDEMYYLIVDSATPGVVKLARTRTDALEGQAIDLDPQPGIRLPHEAAIDASSLTDSNGLTLTTTDTGADAVLAAAEDFNGDGYADVLIGSLDPVTQTANSSIQFGSAQAGPRTTQLPGALVLGGIGDINHDRIDDILVGVPDSGSSTGRFYVVYGDLGVFPDSLDVTTLDGQSGFRIDGVRTADLSSVSAGRAGDFNLDGIEDFVLGVPSALDSKGNLLGDRSYVVYGARNLGARGSIDISALAGQGSGADQRLFSAEGDGLNGVFYDAGLFSTVDSAEMAIHSMDPDAAFISTRLDYPANGSGSWVDTNSNGLRGYLGSSSGDGASLVGPQAGTMDLQESVFVYDGYLAVETPGTYSFGVNGDDGFKLTIRDQVVVERPTYSGRQSEPIVGSVTFDRAGLYDLSLIHFERRGNTSIVLTSDIGTGGTGDLQVIDTSLLHTVGGVQFSRPNGVGHHNIQGAGDVNGDEIWDVIIGSAKGHVAHVVYGSNTPGTAINLPALEPGEGFEFFGSGNPVISVAGIGDFNGDGFDDVAIGEETAKGRVYVVYGGAQLSYLHAVGEHDGSKWFYIDGMKEGDRLGASLSGGGNLDDDRSFGNLVIGAPGAGGGLGQTLVLFGAPDITNGTGAFNLASHAVEFMSDLILAENPIGYWRFNEGSVATALDSSYSEADGAVGPGVTIGQVSLNTALGTAYHFDGSVNGVVDVGNSPFGTLVNNITVSAWINPDLLSGVRRIWGVNGSGTNAPDWAGIGFGTKGTGLRFTTFGVKDYDIAVPGGIQTGVWTHVAAVMDGNNDVEFFVNGVSIGTVSGSNPATTTGLDNFTIGGVNRQERWAGFIDEVAVYGHALDAATIQAQYKAGLNLVSLDGEVGFVINGSEATGQLGTQVAGLGDFDGDGADDFGMRMIPGSELTTYLYYGKTVAAEFESVNGNANTVTFTEAPKLATGTEVRYAAASGKRIGGLVGGETYYLIATADAKVYKLADTADNAGLGRAIDLDTRPVFESEDGTEIPFSFDDAANSFTLEGGDYSNDLNQLSGEYYDAKVTSLAEADQRIAQSEPDATFSATDLDYRSGPTWASGTQNHGHTLSFQYDGNLLIHAADGTVIFESVTANGQQPGQQGGRKMILYSDGRLVIVNAAGEEIWQVGVSDGRAEVTSVSVAPGFAYNISQARGILTTSDGSYGLNWQGDGNLVIYGRTLEAYLGVDADDLSGLDTKTLGGGAVFSFRGFIEIDAAGTYVFEVRDTDGYRLTLNGETIERDGTGAGFHSTSQAITFDEPGFYGVTLLSYQHTLTGGIRLRADLNSSDPSSASPAVIDTGLLFSEAPGASEATSQKLTYRGAFGTTLVGLIEGETYYSIQTDPLDGARIRLAATFEAAATSDGVSSSIKWYEGTTEVRGTHFLGIDGIGIAAPGLDPDFGETMHPSDLTGRRGFTVTGSNAGGQAGESVYVADIDADGKDDLLLGGSDQYGVYGFQDRDLGDVDLGNLTDDQGFTTDLGQLLGSAGDLNGDGHEDMAYGDPDGNGPITILFGRADGGSGTIGTDGMFDFGAATSPLSKGYTRVTAATTYDATQGYGWTAGSINQGDRAIGDYLERDFNFTAHGSFAVDLPNGSYDITLILGDKGNYLHDSVGVFLQGNQVDEVTTQAGEVVTKTYRRILVRTGQLLLTLRSLGGSDPNAVIEGMRIDSSNHGMFDFGTSTSPLTEGYTRVTTATTYDAAQGYGWTAGTIHQADRAIGDDLERDFNYTPDGSFAVDLANGSYDITLVLGDKGTSRHDNVGVFLQGNQVDEVTTQGGEVVTNTYRHILVRNGQLRLTLRSLGGSDPNAVIEGMRIDSSNFLQIQAGQSTGLGSSLTHADMNGDGLDDLVIGSQASDRTFVLFGDEDILENSYLTDTVVEYGELTDVTGQPVSVVFENSYLNPVVFANPPSRVGNEPVKVRIDNLTATGFDISLASPSNVRGHPFHETTSWFVFEAGRHTLSDGTVIEVGTFDTAALTKQTNGFTTIHYSEQFVDTPVVFTQIQTSNDDTYHYTGTRQKNIGKAGFQVALEHEEGKNTNAFTHAVETIGWLAAEKGGTDLMAADTGNGWTSQFVNDAKKLSFGTTLAEVPSFLAGMQTYADSDPAGLRYYSLGTGSVHVFLEEDPVVDKDLYHTPENVGYMLTNGREGTLSTTTLGIDIDALDGARGFIIEGAGGGLGASAASAGDVNRDGYEDIIVGDTAGDTAYVVYGRPTDFDESLSVNDLDGKKTGFELAGLAGTDTGWAVAGIEDINGDDADEILISAPAASPGGKAGAGEVYLVFGSTRGFNDSLDLTALDGSRGITLNGSAAGDAAGSALAAAGDVNGDLLEDFVVGSPLADPGGVASAGQAHVLFGSEDIHELDGLELGTLAGRHGFEVNGAGAGDRMGSSVGSGDINGDQASDVVVGAPGTDVGSVTDAGQVSVVFGISPNAVHVFNHDFQETAGLTPGTLQSFVQKGTGLAPTTLSGNPEVKASGSTGALIGVDGAFADAKLKPTVNAYIGGLGNDSKLLGGTITARGEVFVQSFSASHVKAAVTGTEIGLLVGGGSANAQLEAGPSSSSDYSVTAEIGRGSVVTAQGGDVTLLANSGDSFDVKSSAHAGGIFELFGANTTVETYRNSQAVVRDTAQVTASGDIVVGSTKGNDTHASSKAHAGALFPMPEAKAVVTIGHSDANNPSILTAIEPSTTLTAAGAIDLSARNFNGPDLDTLQVHAQGKSRGFAPHVTFEATLNLNDIAQVQVGDHSKLSASALDVTSALDWDDIKVTTQSDTWGPFGSFTTKSKLLGDPTANARRFGTSVIPAHGSSSVHINSDVQGSKDNDLVEIKARNNNHWHFLWFVNAHPSGTKTNDVSIHTRNDFSTLRGSASVNQLSGIIDRLEILIDLDHLDQKDADKLIKHLEKAHEDLTEGENNKAIKEVEKFKDDVEKLVEKGSLSALAAASILEAADYLIALASDTSQLQQSTQSLSDGLKALVDSGDLPARDADKLLKELDDAIKDFKKLNVKKGLDDPEKFIKEVEKLVDKGDLPADEAQSLLNEAEAVIDSALHLTSHQKDTKALIGDVKALVESGELSDRDGEKLISDLEKAINEFGRLDLEKGAEKLEKFIEKVEKLVDKVDLSQADGESLTDAAHTIIDSVIPPTPLQQDTKNLIGEGNDAPVGGPADDIPDGGAGDSRLIDRGREPEDWQHITVHPGSDWIKPFVCDFKPDDPNEDIELVLADLVE